MHKYVRHEFEWAFTVHEAEAERLQAEWEDNAKQANEKVR